MVYKSWNRFEEADGTIRGNSFLNSAIYFLNANSEIYAKKTEALKG